MLRIRAILKLIRTWVAYKTTYMVHGSDSGPHLGLLFAIGGWGEGSPRAVTHGMVLGHPQPPKLLLCVTSWRFASAESTGVPSRAPVGIFSSHSSPFWVLYGCGGGGGGSALEWRAWKRWKSMHVILDLLAPRPEKWGTSGILRWQTQSIFTAVSSAFS